MKKLSVNAENFSVIRESLKNGENVVVNEKVTLTSYIPNTEKVNENGKKTRTPFYYIDKEGKRYTSTTLKEVLGIEPETKGERETTTFAKVWEQAKGLAKQATSKELKEAAKYLTELAKEVEEREKESKEEEELQTLLQGADKKKLLAFLKKSK